MRITKKYSITHPDTYNYCLVEHKVKGADSKNAGEEYLDIIGYFGTVDAACIKAMHKSIDVKNMQTIIDSIATATKEITSAVRKQGKLIKAEEDTRVPL